MRKEKYKGKMNNKNLINLHKNQKKNQRQKKEWQKIA